MRTLEYRKNNAYDSVLLCQDGRVVGAWDVTGEVARNYLQPGDLEEWNATHPDNDNPDDYGELLSRREAITRIAVLFT